jgi:hypothetical protein
MSDPPTFVNLPTGKPHVSFSEMRDWQDCSFRHQLKHVKHIDLGKPGPLMDFGTAVHSACESYLRTRVMDNTIAHNSLTKTWEKYKGVEGFDEKSLAQFFIEADAILAEVPKFVDDQFPGWEFVDAEHQLYESIPNTQHAFKGFIDGVIKTKDKKGNDLIWLIDWKTTSWGWASYKKSDPHVTAQLVLYKNFWSTKTGTNPKSVRCAFALLKRAAKPGNHCELVKVSVGEVTSGRSLKVIGNMLSSVRRGVAIKNRSSCLYCEYKDTEHCT